MIIETSRVSFKENKQMKFLRDAKLKLGLGWKELAARLGTNSGTLHSYYYGYSSLPLRMYVSAR